MNVEYSTEDNLHEQEVVALYKVNKWSSAEKPQALMAALANSHSVVTARVGGKLVGLGNAISDGHLVVYYPHLLVDPEFQRQGIGKEMMKYLQKRYTHFHQQMLTADVDAVAFYQSIGFSKAGKTSAMWIYQGDEH
ncbi:MAG: GNAT family N-acetyltransferase [Verrucomicrobiota bacterium]